MSKVEILAPVGGQEQLIAAVRSGADAVYLGAQNFNARRNASNFASPELSDVVSYCHARGVKVYVTLNTLLQDKEEQSFLETVQEVAQSGADAVIVQDLYAARLIRECCPQITLHASTQMTVHNVSGAKAMKELGFSRVVLARELSLPEIEKICKEADIEIECFIHGALCMCMSGACYLSSVLGGRSGNRGLCAQPCRLDFTFGKKDHALSLKDMSYIEYIQKLKKIGVCSFKIEGRMKRPEYVGAAVDACRKAIKGESFDLEQLQSVFSRSGFTDGYLTGKRGPDMFGYRRKEDVLAGEKVFSALRSLYKDEYSGIPVDMHFVLKEGKAADLSVTDGEYEITSEGGIPEKARNRSLDQETALRYFSKTGGTPFYLRNFSWDGEEGYTLAASELNAMRRDALQKLLEKRGQTHSYAFYPAAGREKKAHLCGKVEIRVRVQTAEQLDQFDDAEKLIVPLKVCLALSQEKIKALKEKTVCELPPLVFPSEENHLTEALEKLRDIGFTEVIAENIGAFYLAQKMGFAVHGGSGLNILNSGSLREYERMGAKDATVSFEMNANGIEKLEDGIDRGIIGYGYLPLMRMRACPAGGPVNCKNCNGAPILKDRYKTEFSLLCEERKFVTLLNSVPLYIADKKIGGIDFVTLYFTKETPKECREIFELYGKKNTPDFPRTGGLYFRELL